MLDEPSDDDADDSDEATMMDTIHIASPTEIGMAFSVPGTQN